METFKIFLDSHQNRAEQYQPKHYQMLQMLFLSHDKSYDTYVNLCLVLGINYVSKEYYPFS